MDRATEEEEEAVVASAELDLVCRLALSSIGPHGQHQGIRANRQSSVGTLSSVSRRVFEPLKLRTWKVRALVNLTVQPQVEAFGDGGLLSVAVAAKLLQTIQASCSSPFDSFAVTQALESVLEFLRAKLKVDSVIQLDKSRSIQPIKRLSWNDLDSLVALVRAVVAPKLKSVCDDQSEDVDHVCATLARAYALALPEGKALRKPHIGLMKVVGPPIAKTHATSKLVSSDTVQCKCGSSRASIGEKRRSLSAELCSMRS